MSATPGTDHARWRAVPVVAVAAALLLIAATAAVALTDARRAQTHDTYAAAAASKTDVLTSRVLLELERAVLQGSSPAGDAAARGPGPRAIVAEARGHLAVIAAPRGPVSAAVEAAEDWLAALDRALAGAEGDVAARDAWEEFLDRRADIADDELAEAWEAAADGVHRVLEARARERAVLTAFEDEGEQRRRDERAAVHDYAVAMMAPLADAAALRAQVADFDAGARILDTQTALLEYERAYENAADAAERLAENLASRDPHPAFAQLHAWLVEAAEEAASELRSAVRLGGRAGCTGFFAPDPCPALAEVGAFAEHAGRWGGLDSLLSDLDEAWRARYSREMGRLWAQ